MAALRFQPYLGVPPRKHSHLTNRTPSKHGNRARGVAKVGLDGRSSSVVMVRELLLCVEINRLSQFSGSEPAC